MLFLEALGIYALTGTITLFVAIFAQMAATGKAHAPTLLLKFAVPVGLICATAHVLGSHY